MSRRITQLDGIRALAILGVFLFHSLNVKLLWMGVDLFFVLSGFLITGILLEQKKHDLGKYFSRFYRRRAQRILPPYVVLLALTTILSGWGWMRHVYMYLFLMNLIQPLHISQPAFLMVLWSLAVEEQFYFFWPVIVYFLSETAIAGVAVALIATAPVLRWFCTPLFSDTWPVYYLTPFRMDCLACGALLAIIWHRKRSVIERYGHYGLALVGVSLAVLVKLSTIGGYQRTSNTQRGNTVLYELTLLISLGMILWPLAVDMWPCCSGVRFVI